MKVKFGVLKQTDRLHLQAEFHLNVFTVSTSGGLKPQFWQILNFGGLLYRLPFTDKAQIWCPEADRASTFMCQISSENVHCVGFQWQKKHNFGQILTFEGLLYRPPITAESQIWCVTADPQHTFTCQNLSRSV